MASFLGRHGEEEGVLPAFVLIESARAEKLAVDARRPIIGLRFQRHAATMATNVGRRKRACSRPVGSTERYGPGRDTPNLDVLKPRACPGRVLLPPFTSSAMNFFA